jgi:hypothetical protein
MFIIKEEGEKGKEGGRGAEDGGRDGQLSHTTSLIHTTALAHTALLVISTISKQRKRTFDNGENYNIKMKQIG